MVYYTTVFVLLATLLFSILTTEGVNINRGLFTNEPCGRDFFRCDNDKCIPRHFRCDKDNDCGDRSDEIQCSIALTSMTFQFESIVLKKDNAEKWILDQAKKNVIERYGYWTPRIAVALYLANETYFYPHNETGLKISTELGYQFLSKLALKDLSDISVTDLATYINAFLLSCINPRDFQGLDLVAELRNRVNDDEYVNPFVMIALCNAGDNITEEDIGKLNSSFNLGGRKLWTDIQALSLMALSCAHRQNKNLTVDLRGKANVLKQQQNSTSGAIDNLKTTALVIQALIASNEMNDQRGFNSSHAILQLFNSQTNSGSFNSDVLKTYFILPIFNYKTLIDINSTHCIPPTRTGNENIREWMESRRKKHSIQYSLWLGDDPYLEHTLQLLVPEGTTFYKIMQVAAQLDSKYRFQSAEKSGKPYVYSVSSIEDDPENGQFWFLYKVIDNKNSTMLIDKSPLDYVPAEDEHLTLWFKKGPWNIY